MFCSFNGFKWVIVQRNHCDCCDTVFMNCDAMFFQLGRSFAIIWEIKRVNLNETDSKMRKVYRYGIMLAVALFFP